MAEAGDLPTQTVLAIVGVALGFLVLSAACWAWLVKRLASGRSPWPDRPERPVPWGGREILLGLGVWFGCQFLAAALIERPAPGQPTPVVTLMKHTAIANIGAIVFLPVVLRFSCGATLSDLGLKRGWIATDIGLGLLAAGLLTPSIYVIQFAAIQKWPPREHPVLTMLVQERSPGVIALAMTSAVVLAPLAEELIFRGLFQGALERRLLFSSNDRARSRLGAPSGGPTAIPARRPEDLWRLEEETRPEASLVEDEPTVAESRLPEEEPTHAEGSIPGEEPTFIEEPPRSFVIEPQVPAANAPADRSADGLNTAAERSAPEVAAEPGPWSFESLLSLLGPAALFAAVHFDQWPAPLPLFVLAVGLGLLFRKTKSLVAPITLHAAFNGFSTGMLLLLIALGIEVNPERVGLEGTGSAPAGAASATGSENVEPGAPSDPKQDSGPGRARPPMPLRNDAGMASRPSRAAVATKARFPKRTVGTDSESTRTRRVKDDGGDRRDRNRIVVGSWPEGGRIGP